MASLFSLPRGARVLDPCFGRGAFLAALAKVGKYEVEGAEIDPASYEYCAPRFSERCSLRHADFFSYGVRGDFDGIIMNPPYVRHEEIDALSCLGVDKRRLAQAVSERLDPKSNLYMYFVIYGLELLRPDGELVAIFPNSWEKAKSGESFRKAIERGCSITEHIDVKGNPFHGKPVVDVEILKIKKTRNIATEYKEIEVDEDTLTEGKGKALITIDLGQTVPLSDIATTRRGKTTGYNKMFINPPVMDSSLLVDIVSSPRGVHGFSTRGCKTDKYLYIRSDDAVVGDVKLYLDDCAKAILADRKPKSLYDAIETRRRWYDTCPAYVGDIIFPYIIRGNIRFIRNDGRKVARDNFYTINSPIDTSLLMSLLNNHYVWYQLEQCGKSYGNNVLKIQKYDVDALRVVKPSSISGEDKALLTDCGERLAAGGSLETIGAITRVLKKYYAANDIESAYERARSERFGK